VRAGRAADEEHETGERAHTSAAPAASAVPVAVHAAIDVGSNSVHLLVAAVSGDRIEPLIDESVFLGLGDRVRITGTVGRDLRGRLASTLAVYAATARRLDARSVEVVCTEPIRRAADAARAVFEASAAGGVPVHVLDHEEEGILTLLGVTSGRRLTSDLLVVDVGGGSCEFAMVRPRGRPEARGLQLGSAALTAELVQNDPPLPREIRALHQAARLALRAAPDARPTEIVAVGGTASNLARVTPPESDGHLTRGAVAAALDALVAEPSAVAVSRYGVNPIRARILPAGAAIVLAILDRYDIERIRVSDAGIREGLVLAAFRAGRAWRDRLAELASGLRS